MPEPAEASELPESIERISLSILHICKKGILDHKPPIYPWPKSPIVTNEKSRIDLAIAIDEASIAYEIDHYLMVAIAYREGSFRGRKDGKLGEKGTFQVMKLTAKFINKHIDPECTLDTLKGSAICSAALLDYGRKKCRTKHGMVIYYASGHCTSSLDNTNWIARDRLGIAKYLKNIYGPPDVS
jgi:hypothetical protein